MNVLVWPWLFLSAVTLVLGVMAWLTATEGTEAKWSARIALTAPLWPIWLGFALGFACYMLGRGLVTDAVAKGKS